MLDWVLIGVLVAALLIAIIAFQWRPGRRRYRELDGILRSSSQSKLPKNIIFISYRRADTQDMVARLQEHLQKLYGTEAIFRDVDGIEAGEDYREALQHGLRDCRIFLCVIGRRWFGGNGNGGRSIDAPGDLVRMEVETALKRNILIIPLLVHDCPPPPPESLPESISHLSFRQALKLRGDQDFPNDIDRLRERLDAEIDRNQDLLSHHKQ